MKIVITTGVMVMGTAVFPETEVKEGNKKVKKPTVIDVDKKIAKELILSKQAKAAPSSAKVNVEIKPLEKEEEDGFGDFFDEDEEGEDGNEE